MWTLRHQVCTVYFSLPSESECEHQEERIPSQWNNVITPPLPGDQQWYTNCEKAQQKYFPLIRYDLMTLNSVVFLGEFLLQSKHEKSSRQISAEKRFTKLLYSMKHWLQNSEDHHKQWNSEKLSQPRWTQGDTVSQGNIRILEKKLH